MKAIVYSREELNEQSDMWNLNAMFVAACAEQCTELRDGTSTYCSPEQPLSRANSRSVALRSGSRSRVRAGWRAAEKT